ncbi:MAG: transposase [Roseovarius sp.]|nr:transposase [Roseovarius sp.]
MSNRIRFSDEFKQDAVAQVVERGYAVSEVAERLGISTKSLYTWKAQFAKSQRARSEVADRLLRSSG